MGIIDKRNETKIIVLLKFVSKRSTPYEVFFVYGGESSIRTSATCRTFATSISNKNYWSTQIFD